MRRNLAITRYEEPKLALAPLQSFPVVVPPAAKGPGGLAGWVLRCFGGRANRPPQPKKRLHVVEQISLGGKRQLSLVECDGQRILVGSSEQGVQSMMFVPMTGEKPCC